MKIDIPVKGSRWFRFTDPQNTATIVNVTHILDNGWIRTDPPFFKNNQSLNYWTPLEFSKEFRPI